MKRPLLLFLLLYSAEINCFSQTDASLNFDGSNDIVTMGNVNALEITGDLTLECWANLTQLTTLRHFMGQGVAGTDADGANTNILYFFTMNANKTIQLFMEYSTGINVVPVSSVAASINTGEWHHYAVVRNATAKTVDFYVDGTKLGGTVAYSNNPDGGATGPFTIGGTLRNDNSVENPFNGFIDEVRVWNVARTQAEIQDNLNCSVSSAANLVASYNFNNGVPNSNNAGITTIVDGSGNGYDGTLTDFALTGASSNFTADVVFFTPAGNLTSDDADDTIDDGTEVTFTIQPVNAGSAPTYQWQKNGSDIIGETGTTYVTDELSDGDEIQCVVDPSTTCFAGTVSSNAITMTVNAISLPLRLISFTAKEKDCSSTLEWKTTDEMNVSGFEVEQSRDGILFSVVKTIHAVNTAGENSYSAVIPVTGNKILYRLKMIDLDGRSTYSDVITVNAHCSGNILVYPNPVKDKIFIHGAATGSRYMIYDNTGRKLMGGVVTKENESVNITNWRTGIYYLVCTGKSYKIIKE